MHTVDVLIIGAGPAGLTAGYLLTKQSDLSVAIIEKDPRYVGGISRTEVFEGHYFDIGGHRFFSKSADVVALWKELLPDDFIERPRSSRIFYQGKYFRYPLDGMEALKNLGVMASLRCVLSYAKARLFPNKHPTTFHQWVANQFGERLYAIFFKTYTEKVWGMSCDDISADWAAQRIKGLSLSTAMIRAIKQSLGIRPAAGPDKAAVAKGVYPLTPAITLYVAQPPKQPMAPWIRDYLAMALSDEGQEIIARFADTATGFLPLSADDLKAEREKLKD